MPCPKLINIDITVKLGKQHVPTGVGEGNGVVFAREGLVIVTVADINLMEALKTSKDTLNMFL